MKNIIFLFFTLSIQFCFAIPSAEKIENIKIIVNQLNRDTMFNNISIDHQLLLPNPAAAFYLGDKKYFISFNDSIFSTLTESAQDLVAFHELGHVYLGHTEMSTESKNRFEVELEADYFAAYVYKRFEKTNKDIFDFINFISLQKTTIPSGELRAGIFNSIINN